MDPALIVSLRFRPFDSNSQGKDRYRRKRPDAEIEMGNR